jgi:multimeric flavodoxin WrbA
MAPAPLKFIALNCSLKSTEDGSSTEALLRQISDALAHHDCTGEIVRVVELDIKPGVTADEGKGDGWPKLRARILAADVVVIGTPIWLGQPSSVAKRICERMNAFLDETDDNSRLPSYGKVAVVAVVGNEDGAHHVSAEMYQALNDCGFAIPPNAVTYWVGEAMGDTDYKDLAHTPRAVSRMTAMLASNAVHLARLLKRDPFPGNE